MPLKHHITGNFTEEIGDKFSYLKFIHSPLYCKSTVFGQISSKNGKDRLLNFYYNF